MFEMTEMEKEKVIIVVKMENMSVERKKRLREILIPNLQKYVDEMDFDLKAEGLTQP